VAKKEKTGKKAPSPAQSTAGAEEAPSLEEVVIALQKTFSRVSTSTAQVAEHRARAMVTGKVAFKMNLAVAMGDDDRLLTSAEGPIALELSGTLDTDVRVQELDTGET
jgi:hypothetical protein